MLKKLTTKNFRKLTNNTFEFGEGLQVVRGSNEQGKSTMLEAIAYALAGVKACRDALEEVVTWGEPVRSLKVELVLEFDGVDYTITRSKAGAEINYAGGTVVGQSECTAFMERLLGVDSGTIARLMIAPQGTIRGALGEKSGKAMELIEQLANFGIIDTVVELIQNKLVTGPTTTAEDRVQRAELALHEAEQLAVEPDTAAVDAQIAEARAELGGLVKNLEEALKPALDKAQVALDAARATEQKRALLQQQIEVAQANRSSLTQQCEAARAVTGPHPDELSRVRGQLEDAKTATMRYTAWQRVQDLMKGYPAAYWEGGAASLQEDFDAISWSVSRLSASLSQIDADTRALKQDDVAGAKCRACGQDLPDAAAIERHNSEVKAKLGLLSSQRLDVAKELQAAQTDYKELVDVQKAARPFELMAAEMGELIEVDLGFVPPKLAWKGEQPSKSVDAAALQQELKALEEKQQAAQFAAGRVSTLTQQLEQLGAEENKLRAGVFNCGEGDVAEAERVFNGARAEHEDHFLRVTHLRGVIETALRQISDAKQQHQQMLNAVEKCRQEAKGAQKELKELEFNNSLLKRVRAARPIIADKLWTIVLSSTSAYFSAMRGIKSVVSRAGNEFRVDGKPISGLSGSATDLLGLAIRISLCRTFLGQCDWLILDEPAAACDDSREEAMLGFLMTAGFNQTLLVTHSDAEHVAQNLITI